MSMLLFIYLQKLQDTAQYRDAELGLVLIRLTESYCRAVSCSAFSVAFITAKTNHTPKEGISSEILKLKGF